MDNYVNYDITDEQWKRIQPLLPPEYTGKKGRPRKDNRIMLNGKATVVIPPKSNVKERKRQT